MEELNEEVVEETTDSVEETTEENQEQPIEEVVEEIDESKFDSAGNDAVIKVDLDKSPSAKNVEEDITKVNVDEKTTEDIYFATLCKQVLFHLFCQKVIW